MGYRKGRFRQRDLEMERGFRRYYNEAIEKNTRSPRLVKGKIHS